MVKLRKASADDVGGSSTAAGDYLAISGYASSLKEYRRKRLIRVKVLRMLTPRRAGPVGPEEIGDGPDDKGTSSAASGAVTPGSYENGEGSREFLLTGRTGRRNAMPNILGRHAETGLSDLPDRFGALSTHTDQSTTSSGQDPNIPGTSKQHG